MIVIGLYVAIYALVLIRRGELADGACQPDATPGA